MAFKITARTLLHLGAELISSDAVALYELIKNAFDAGSTSGVHIEVNVRLKGWPGVWPTRLAKLSGPAAIKEAKTDLIADHDSTAPGAAAWVQRVREADDAAALRAVAEEANEITIRDTGHGMSKADLNEVYLTIGTRYRREERESQRQQGDKGRAILGEKGLGRLSVMRLGQWTRVETTRQGEAHWNVLELDWSRFSHDSEELLEDIGIEPHTGARKSSRTEHGTKITVRRLNGRWEKLILKHFAENEAAKFNRPFQREKRYPIFLRFNGEIVPLLDFEPRILNNAHAHVRVDFTVENGEPRLRVGVDYRLKKRKRNYAYDGAHLVSLSESDPATLQTLGAFSMEAFWFNRQLLRSRVDGGVEISNIVNQWSGGLMLFRDGFRIMPYGDQSDDWLDLDRRALASQGYKVNRKQLIGYVEIGSLRNPALTDQTSREGLRDNPEKIAMVNMLKHVLEVDLRRFLNEVDKEEKVRLQLSFETIGERVRREKVTLRNSLRLLRQRRSETPEEKTLFNQIDENVDELEKMMADAQSLAAEFERGHSQYLHLAGLGLMVEFLAHELNRATQHALRTLADGRASKRSLTSTAMQTLELQLKTLQKRLSTLDPATTSGRNRAETFDVAELAQQVLDGHAAEFDRHHIGAPAVTVLPRSQQVRVKMVKGMVIQVLENLIGNAAYWLKAEQRARRNFVPKIVVEVDVVARELRVTDNGPGVREDLAEDIFKPFFTTKPPGEGKGLGLYIARELAHYHEMELRLAPEQRIHSGCHNTFVLTLPK